METMRRERPREDDDDGEEETNSLPPEIITEILLRLPAKSIGKFRCVSKLFCSLSSNPGFAKSHLDLILRNDSTRSSHRKLIVSSESLSSIDLDSVSYDVEKSKDLAAVELNYPLKDEPSVFEEMIRSYLKENMSSGDRSEILRLKARSYRPNCVEIFGSSYGLVCISPDEDVVFLYNPTTGESKRLPESLHPTTNEKFHTYGFGFDDLTNDYKVVKLLANGDNARIAIVYSLKTNSWRYVCDLSYEHSYCYNSGVYFNDSIHWVFTCSSYNKRSIVSFDLKTDEIREIPLPDEAEDCPHSFRNFVVGNFNGSLCVVNNCSKVHDDIWVMNVYGEASSWSRIRISLSYRSMKPLCSITHNEDVLLELDGDMVLYNFKTDTSKKLRIRGVNLFHGFESNTYVESLVSPNSYVIES